MIQKVIKLKKEQPLHRKNLAVITSELHSMQEEVHHLVRVLTQLVLVEFFDRLGDDVNESINSQWMISSSLHMQQHDQ